MMEKKLTVEELVKALRCCNHSKGHRCSECPIFSRYAYGVCKRNVDAQAADALGSLAAERIRTKLAIRTMQRQAEQRRRQDFIDIMEEAK